MAVASPPAAARSALWAVDFGLWRPPWLQAVQSPLAAGLVALASGPFASVVVLGASAEGGATLPSAGLAAASLVGVAVEPSTVAPASAVPSTVEAAVVGAD